MAGSDNGALGRTFKVVRILQGISLVAIIGMAAYFISQMVSNSNAPSDVIVGTLSVVSSPKMIRCGSVDVQTDHCDPDLHRGVVLCHHVYSLR